MPINMVYRASHRRLRSQSPRSQQCRRGVIAFELLLTLPIVIIALMAIVEFGLILASLKHVEFASRVGAKVASEEPTGTLATSIATVRAKVDKVLANAGIGSCQVILEHNVPAACVIGGTLQSSGTCNKCDPPVSPLPISFSLPGGTVRVTVCVDLSEITPDLLGTFGFSTANRSVIATTTFAYENCNP